MNAQQLIALNIRRLRVAKGISQDDLALIAGVERSYVGHLERSSKNPTVKTLEKIAIALTCDISELFAPLPLGTTAIEPLKSGRKTPGI
jgi:transcriptional regulator with XRE-family HTH domain